MFGVAQAQRATASTNELNSPSMLRFNPIALRVPVHVAEERRKRVREAAKESQTQSIEGGNAQAV
ncbi:MAG: hypothetical protein R3E39_24175 [Anaerolineae bacterium]